jgi:hypothetical protein
MTRKGFTLGLAILAVVLMSQPMLVAVQPTCAGQSGSPDDAPAIEYRRHTAGKVGFTITNWGVFHGGEPWPSPPELQCEFPKGAQIEHLAGGGLWLGAIASQDTLVSTGADGWFRVNEMYPLPDGSIQRRSSDPADSSYSDLAISDEEFIAVYFDTLTDAAYVDPDPISGRPHLPLGLQIRQISYCWGNPPYEDFIVCRQTLSNIGDNYLESLSVGFFFDPDICHLDTAGYGWTDDISGLLTLAGGAPEDDLLIAWAADNDGDPVAGEWAATSARHAFSVTLIDFPTTPEYGFNWWFSHLDPDYNWGPCRQADGPDSLPDILGTPIHDADKYRVMTNGSLDFDQVRSADSSLYEQWMPPSSMAWAADIADGYDARFLYSFGSVDLAPGDSLDFALVFAMGENLHTSPTAFDSLFDYEDPNAFYESLDFTDLENNVLAAKALYDSIMDQSTAAHDAPIAELPRDFQVRQNYPNPFNRSTTIEFVADRPAEVTLEVFNLMGQRVWAEVLGAQPGANRMEWEAVDGDGVELPSGVYFYRISTEWGSQVKKMVFLK